MRTLPRREFLMGRLGRAPREVARVGAGCLERLGIACGSCRDACGVRAIGVLPPAGGIAGVVIDPQRCNGCGDCLEVCPPAAIDLERNHG